MYSAARSRPREGVPRPSSRSDAIKERWPRNEAAEIRRSTASVLGSSGATGGAAPVWPAAISRTIRTRSAACRRPRRELMRQISVRFLLADLLVGVPDLGGQESAHPVLHIVRQRDRRARRDLVAIHHFRPSRNDVGQLLALLHRCGDGLVQLSHELPLALQHFLAARSAVSGKNVRH